MSTENLPAETRVGVNKAVPGNTESKVLKFDENNTVSSGKDINTKITTLDVDLAQLRAELVTINNSVEEGLDRLGDTDTDLTAKVSETYKRLGEIDNAYKALMEISSRIDNDIQKLNGDVSTVAEQSATGIKTLEQSTVAQTNEFTQKNQQVVSRVNQLVETSKLTSELLGQKIQSTTDSLLQVEKNVIAEIESLSDVTEEKTNALENSISATKAKILKLQSVDEAIIRRATTLEISAAELTAKSQQLESSTNELHSSTERLSAGLNRLQERTQALEVITNSHGSFIDGLQKATSDITEKLTVLAGREKKHFNIFSAIFLLLVFVTAVIYFAQQNQFKLNEIRDAERNADVDSQVADLQQMQASSVVTTNNSLAALENKIDQVNLAIQDEIKKEIAQIDRTVKSVQDQVQSVEGRLSQTSPRSQLGNDNIIHSAQWIAELPQRNFTVQLALVEDKNTLFEIAQRYNSHLNDSLSYFEIYDHGATKYVLLSGNYTTQQQARAVVHAMPRYIDNQQPVIRSLGAVQKFIAH